MKIVSSVALYELVICALIASDALAGELDKQLEHYRRREENAKMQIAQLQAEIATLKQDIENYRSYNRKLKEQLYARLGVSAGEVEALLARFQSLEDQTREFSWAFAQDLRLFESALFWAEDQWQRLSFSPAVALETVRLAQSSCLRAIQDARIAFEKRRDEVQDLWDSGRVPEPQSPEAREESPKSSGGLKIEEMRGNRGVRVIRVGKLGQSGNATLWDIAGQVYGDPSKWQRLWRANWPAVQNPDRIYPGQELIVPDGPVKKPAGMR